MSRRRIHIPNRVLDSHRETVPLGTPEFAGRAVAPPRSGSPIIVESAADHPLQGHAMHADPMHADPMHGDWRHLIAIARRHAAIALAGPADERDSRLDACRLVWLHYAAAFGASVTAQARFADELRDVTRSLMNEQQRSARAAHHPIDTSQVAAPIITIEELRPLLKQIMRE